MGVIVAGSGSWTGAAGVDVRGRRLTSTSRLLTASVGKTVTAAQVLRLVDEGALDLDHPAADYFPPELGFFKANGATVRDLLGMRSGFVDPPNYTGLVDRGVDIPHLVRRLVGPFDPPGSTIVYANINFVLLGAIIEHVTGRALWDVFHSGALDRPRSRSLDVSAQGRPGRRRVAGRDRRCRPRAMGLRAVRPFRCCPSPRCAR